MPKLHQKGFTLIELLIVVAIIVILTALIATSYTTIQRNSRDTQRKGDLAAVAGALERFYTDSSHYPAASSGRVSYNNDCSVTGTPTPETWGSGDINCNGNSYLRQLPIDPTRIASAALQYCYVSANPNQNYQLYAALEGSGNLSPAVNNPPGCSGSYNYRITSND